MVELAAWLIVLLEVQAGILLFAFWTFKLRSGFAHWRLPGVAVTVYTRQGRRGGIYGSRSIPADPYRTLG